MSNRPRGVSNAPQKLDGRLPRGACTDSGDAPE